MGNKISNQLNEQNYKDSENMRKRTEQRHYYMTQKRQKTSRNN